MVLQWIGILFQQKYVWFVFLNHSNIVFEFPVILKLGISLQICVFLIIHFWYSKHICKYVYALCKDFESCFIEQNWICNQKVQYQTLVRNFGTFIDLLPNLYLNCYISETFLFSVRNIDIHFLRVCIEKKNFLKIFQHNF